MNVIRAYFRAHRGMCITQLALIAALGVVGVVWGRPWTFMPFLILTALSWVWSGGKWLLFFWTGLFLAAGTYQAFQPEFLAQLPPGDYSHALTLALMLLLLLVSAGGAYQDKLKAAPGAPGRRLH